MTGQTCALPICFIESLGAQARGDGIKAANVASVTIVQTVVTGALKNSVSLVQVGDAQLDADSLLGGAAPLSLNSVGICARDVVYSGLSVAGTNTLVACAGGSRKNANLGSCAPAASVTCSTHCNAGDRALCDTIATPSFEADGTCPLATSVLVDAGADLGLDLVDNDPAAFFLGAAPDLGGRERGSSRVYGGTSYSCP